MKQPFKEIKLNNLLTILLIKDETTPIVAVKTYVRAGSMLEESHLGSGMSHFLEHMIAGGSTSIRSEKKYKDAIATLGGAYNAYTTTDHTCYYINTTEDHSLAAVDILYEWMFKNSFKDKEFKREQSVILKEIEKNQASLSRQFYSESQLNFFKTHPIRYPVIGFEEDFIKLKNSDLKEYYKKTYIPSNMILAIGGNFDETKILTHIKNTFGKEPCVAPITPLIFNEQRPFTSRVIEKEAKTNVTSISMRFATTDLFSKELYPLDLLEFILGCGENCLLHKILVDQKKIAYSVHCTSYTPALTTGYFDIACETEYKNIELVKKEIIKIVDKIKKGSISETAIKEAIKKKVAEDILSISHIEDKVARFAQSYLFAHTPNFFDAYLNNIKKVQKKELVQAANTFLDFDRTVITILKPALSKKEKKTPSQTTLVLKPKLITLKNGLKVILKEDHTIEKTHAKFITLGGLRNETSKTNGIGHFVSELLGKETKNHTKQKLQTYFEGNGAHFQAHVGNNTFYCNLSCLAEDFQKLLPVFKDAMFNATFSDKEIKELKRQTLQWISQRSDDWHTIGSYHFKKEFYKEHPYELNILGEQSTVSKFTKKDVETYYKTLFSTTDTVLSIVGDFDIKKTITQLNKLFGQVKLSPKKINSLKRKPHVKKENHHYDIPQNVGAIFMGFDGETFNNTKNCVKLDLLNTIVSGMAYPTGRLHQELREKGLVYMVHATNQAGNETGHFLINALTSKANIQDVLKIINKELRGVQDIPTSQKEFDQAIAQMKFYYKDRASSIESLTLMMSTDELYGRGFDYYEKINKEIDKLDKKDIQITAKKYLKNAQLFTFSQKA
jgi:zinc protease